MIEADEVCLQYPDGTPALRHISLKIDPGTLFYVVGPSGSGKTSLLKLFMGMEYPTGGSLRVFGQNIVKAELSGIRALRRSIGPVFQDFKLVAGRNALENVMLALRFLGITPGHMLEEAQNALKKVGLEHKTCSLVENLSWGERQRVAIARAAARRPKLILADEPTGNLDKSNALKILSLLASFKQKNTSVIIATHATHLLDDEQNYIELDRGLISRDRSRVYN